MADENQINLDAVKNFGEQLASLYECKMPISKSKMLEVTDAALKGIKLYKHVVMALEKFIMKCTNEYKIPGLYVMDSIIRKSKHRFKAKDVFGPRFEKNFVQTFDLIFASVSDDDKKRALKVVKLWQESSIMTKEILAPCIKKAESEEIDIDINKKTSPVKQQRTPQSPPPNSNHSNSHSAQNEEMSKQFVNQLNSLANTFALKEQETSNLGNQLAYQAPPITQYDNIDPVTGATLSTTASQKPRSSIDENVSGILSKAIGGYSDDEETSPKDDRHKRHKRRRSRSISRDRESKRDRRSSRRSRSRDRDRSAKRSRSRERGSTRNGRTEEDKKEKKEETPEEKEQRRMMLPNVRPQHLLIASRILWLGRLPNLTNADDIANEVHKQLMKESQQKPAVEHIQPAACAFVTFPDRRSAVKAYEKCQSRSRPFEMHGRMPRVSWAAAKTIKDVGEWDEKNGVSFLHWGELARNTLSKMVESGHLVLNSLPAEMQGKFNEQGLAIDQPPFPGSGPLPPSLPPPTLPNTTQPPPSWHPPQGPHPPPQGMPPGFPRLPPPRMTAYPPPLPPPTTSASGADGIVHGEIRYPPGIVPPHLTANIPYQPPPRMPIPMPSMPQRPTIGGRLAMNVQMKPRQQTTDYPPYPQMPPGMGLPFTRPPPALPLSQPPSTSSTPMVVSNSDEQKLGGGFHERRRKSRFDQNEASTSIVSNVAINPSVSTELNRPHAPPPHMTFQLPLASMPSAMSHPPPPIQSASSSNQYAGPPMIKNTMQQPIENNGDDDELLPPGL